MFPLRAFGLCNPLRPVRLPPSALRYAAAKPTPTRCLSTLRRPATQRLLHRVFTRAPRTASTEARKPTSKPLYPDLVNVYRSGTYTTVFLAFFGFASVLSFAWGTLYLFPTSVYAYFHPTDDERTAWYWPVGYFFAGFIPLTALIVAFGPWVHAVHVRVPTAARRSKDDLMRFVRSVPPQTTMTFTYFRFGAYWYHKEFSFEDLRRLRFSRWRLANLVHRPLRNRWEVEDGKAAKWQENLVEKFLGYYYVNMTQSRDKSLVPGVWDEMWEQIPMDGEPSVARGRAEKRAEKMKRIAKPQVPKITRVKPTR